MENVGGEWEEFMKGMVEEDNEGWERSREERLEGDYRSGMGKMERVERGVK